MRDFFNSLLMAITVETSAAKNTAIKVAAIAVIEKRWQKRILPYFKRIVLSTTN